MKIQPHFIRTGFIAFFLLFTGGLSAQEVNLSKASIIATKSIQSPLRETAIRVLQEEVLKRTTISLPEVSNSGKSSLIVLASLTDTVIDGLRVPKRQGDNLPEAKGEGFRIVVEKTGNHEILWLIGKDGRGVLFATGQFLRTAELSKNKIQFNKSNEIATSPAYPIRGHQIGYRNTANSWDAWNPAQFETYFRELALFGANSIENIPFHDGPLGPNMKFPRDFMNKKMSEICNNYGLDYWVWTPADVDLADPAIFKAEVEKHGEFYKSCPRLDGVFFPGGDPGSNHPKYVMPFLKEVAGALHKYHPKAGMWISLQGFSDEQVDYFYDYLDKNNPDWLEGVATGPSSPDLAATRFRLPKKYKHRHYPDLTHTIRCQYPTENWDQAFALTEGREICNPQPFYYAKIHNRYAPLTDGFLSYSDGVHDDVNKATWSQMAWNPEKDVRQVMVEYSRFFFGSSVAESGADGILALERNWVGPVEENGGIETTFAFWQNLEAKHPELKGNWRWQQLVMRSYYDTYVKRRKAYEQNLEKEANQILGQAAKTGSDKAMKDALILVNKADNEPVYPELRNKIVGYCEALFQSIGMQTSVKKYNASGEERGAILDFLDYPLNNRWWLTDEFAKIGKMSTEKEKLDRLEIIRTWENPGPGSYYDNISNISKGPHVKTTTEDATDFVWWDDGMSRKRLSTQLYQNYPRLVYTDLDPNGHYTIRIAGYGDALLRADGERIAPTVYNKGLEEFKEFQLSPKYVSDGKLEITFDVPEESKLNWRSQSKVSDIWLLKR
ncbi:MAG: hypothetical protein WCJ95_01715 [Mariniphaga sp.]